MESIGDALRERRIEKLRADIIDQHKRLHELQQALEDEIHARTPEQVARMERSMGLIA